jgi:L-lactate dehydrogenase (cytochrome)
VNEFVELVRRQVAADLEGLPAHLAGRLSGEVQLARCLTIADLRAQARRRTPRSVFDFVDGAAGDEVTLRRNRDDFERIALRPRVLADAGEVDLTTTVLGRRVAVPVLGAPTGLTGLVHNAGEAAVAAAVQEAGSLYALSCMSSYSLEEVAHHAPGPLWFQVYLWRDRGLLGEMVARAAACRCHALVVTVDVPVSGARERDQRNGFGVPPRITLRTLGEGLVRPRWSAGFLRAPRMRIANATGLGGGAEDAVRLVDYVSRQFDPGATWDDIAWLRSIWDGPVVVKGILRADDARLAVEAGASAVSVSNHGGRQLDGAVSAVRALPEVVEAVGDRAEVYVDGGVRRGADVLKALALGARACLVGRPLVFGLAAGGQAGAARAMAILTAELRLACALAGLPAAREAGRDLLA